MPSKFKPKILFADTEHGDLPDGDPYRDFTKLTVISQPGNALRQIVSLRLWAVLRVFNSAFDPTEVFLDPVADFDHL